MQWRAMTLAGSAMIATMVGTANLLSRLYYDVLQNGDILLAVLLPACAAAGLLLLLLCCCCCYHCRPFFHGTGRLRASRLRGWCLPHKASASQKVQAAEDAAATSTPTA